MPSDRQDAAGAGAATFRLTRPSVVALCGPAGCGKTTFAKRHFRPTQIVSSDHMRALVCDDERDQRFQTQAFALLHFLVEQRLAIQRLCVVDSTALSQPSRRSLLDLARRNHVPCVAMVFDVPLETCVERDQLRARSVGRATVERQYRLFEQVKAGIREEGFDQVIALRGSDLEKVQIEIVFRPVPRPQAFVPRPHGFIPQRPTSNPPRSTGEPGAPTAPAAEALTTGRAAPGDPTGELPATVPSRSAQPAATSSSSGHTLLKPAEAAGSPQS